MKSLMASFVTLLICSTGCAALANNCPMLARRAVYSLSVSVNGEPQPGATVRTKVVSNSEKEFVMQYDVDSKKYDGKHNIYTAVVERDPNPSNPNLPCKRVSKVEVRNAE